MSAGKNYVTDTHSLVWYFTEDQRLGKNALKAFEGTVKSGSVIVPAVVLAEIMFIARKGRITLAFDETLERIEAYENFNVGPLDIDVLKIADGIDADLEMHDKLIVATALFHGAVLITKDERITQPAIVSTVW